MDHITKIERENFNGYIIHPGSVCALCVTDNDVILINSRRNNKSYHLELPGGVIEKSESPLQALEREIKEEIGFSVIENEFIGKYTTSAGITNELVYIFICKVEKTSKSSSSEFEPISMTLKTLINEVSLRNIEDFRVIIAANHMKEKISKTEEKNEIYSRLISLWSVQESLLQTYRSLFLTTQSILFSIAVFIATTKKPYFSMLLFPIGIYLLFFGFRITKKRGFGVWYCILHLHKLDKNLNFNTNSLTIDLHNFMELSYKQKIEYFQSDEVGKSMLDDKTRRGMDYRITYLFILLWLLLLISIIFINYLPEII
ncbi:NUDIX hydrolase [Flavobacterium sp.]|uniref:NUDIX hydrolase n=1 Tax=Flavobacterium sp. TaxID=239 RepID=UPI0039E3FA2F